MVFFEYNTITMKRKLLSLYNYDSQMRYYTRWHSCYPESPDCDQASLVDLDLSRYQTAGVGLLEPRLGVETERSTSEKYESLKNRKQNI